MRERRACHPIWRNASFMTQTSKSPDVDSSSSSLWRIEHAGAATAVGSTAWQSAAAWVGLQKRFRKITLPSLGDVPLTLAPSPEIAGRWPDEAVNSSGGTAGVAQIALQRIARLLAAALLDMLVDVQRPKSSSMTELPITQARGPNQAPQMVVLALPAWLGEERALTVWQKCLELLCQHGGTPHARALAQLPLRVVLSGQTAAFEGLELLNQSGTRPSAALLLAADSWMDIALLETQLMANRLIADKNQDGFVAGEAAAALWLHRVPDTSAANVRQLVLHPPALARSAYAHHDNAREPNPDALTQAFRDALKHAQWKPEHVGNKLSDSDGSAWRALAEIAATARALPGQDPAEWQPATVLGQIGAATGAVHWALAAQRLRHDKTSPNSLLSWALDAGELAAAVAMEKTNYSDEALAAMAYQHCQAHVGDTETQRTFSARFLNNKN